MKNQRLQSLVYQVLLQSLASPQLSYSNISLFRQQFTKGINAYDTALNSVFLGAQASTPGMAFLAGYQNAIRCLDSECPNDQLAAFCVSEKGVKSPWNMQSKITALDEGYYLTGQKGFVMLLPNDLDRLYVVAKDKEGQLKCVFFSRQTTGLDITGSLNIPFIEDIPHGRVCFNDLYIPSSQLMPCDGHYEANKPFRYWEDMHVTLSMMAWMVRECVEEGRILHDDFCDVIGLMVHLIEQFEVCPSYYSSEAFKLFDDAEEALENHSQYLSHQSLKQWKKDRSLMLMGKKIRQIVQEKMSAKT